MSSREGAKPPSLDSFLDMFILFENDIQLRVWSKFNGHTWSILNGEIHLQSLICIILDNYSVHKAKMVSKCAQSLGIILVYLPPYSPDLNPIEFIWKSIKSEISISKIENTFELRECVENNFAILSSSLSYATSWRKKFDLTNWLI